MAIKMEIDLQAKIMGNIALRTREMIWPFPVSSGGCVLQGTDDLRAWVVRGLDARS